MRGGEKNGREANGRDCPCGLETQAVSRWYPNWIGHQKGHWELV